MIRWFRSGPDLYGRRPTHGSSYSPGRFFLVALLFIAAAPLFWQRVELPETTVAGAYENRDLFEYVYPVYSYGFERLRAGSLPLWNPYQNCGVPFLADARAGLFQPLHAVFLAVPMPRALAVHAFVALSLMGFTFALFARSLGVGYVPAFIGGTVYAFSGATAAAMSRPALAAALAWAPFLFWAAGRAARRADAGRIVVAGIALAGFLLSGAHAVIAAMLLPLAPYAVVQLVTARDRSGKALLLRAGGLILAGALGLALSAIQWGPTLVWLRDGGTFDESFWNMHVAAPLPLRLREALMAKAGTLPRLGYYGLATLALVPLAFLHRPLRRYAILFAGAGIPALAAAMLARTAWQGFPLHAFAYPALFCVAGTAALGADRLFAVRPEVSPRRPWIPALVVTVVAAVALFALPPAKRLFAVAPVFAVLPVLTIRRGWAGAFGGFFFALILFTDLSAASTNLFRHPFLGIPAPHDAVQLAREIAPGSRVYASGSSVDRGLPPNLGMTQKVPMVGGALLPRTRDQVLWFQRALGNGPPETAQLQLLNFAAARAFLFAEGAPLAADPPPESGLLLMRRGQADSDVRVRANERALPRAYWVPGCRIAHGVESAATLLSDPSFDTARLCIIDTQSPGYAFEAGRLPVIALDSPVLPATNRREAACTVLEHTPEHIVIRVNAPLPGITVLADTHTPGWQATLDGVPCRILRANGIFRAVITPAGEHEIVYRYRPLDFRIGSAVTLTTLALLAAWGVVMLFKDRSAAGESPLPRR